MRTLARITIPVEAGTAALKDGKMGSLLEGVMKRAQPEASYFYAEGGKRTMIMVFDLKDPSDIPSICEPAFQGLNASIELTPVMNLGDLQSGIAKLMQSP